MPVESEGGIKPILRLCKGRLSKCDYLCRISLRQFTQSTCMYAFASPHLGAAMLCKPIMCVCLAKKKKTIKSLTAYILSQVEQLPTKNIK